jgi:hypothetical protein
MLAGERTTLGVSTARDGAVAVTDGRGSQSATPFSRVRTGPVSSPTACDDSAYSVYSNTWNKPYSWYFNASSTPSEITQAAATGALTTAANDITSGYNNCGMADKVSATDTYKGTTSTTTNISTAAACLSGDGKNVVGFGTLPSSYLAYTCWWTSGNSTIEADVKLNKASYTWYVTKPPSCSNKWDVQGTATHEFGHVFGLGHVDEGTHANLTMSPVIGECQSSEQTLGLGDVKGLESKY